MGSCTIYCAFCGKRRHYEVECYHKQRLSAKLKSEALNSAESARGKSHGEKAKGKSQGRGKGQGHAQGKGGGGGSSDKKNVDKNKDKNQNWSGATSNPSTPGVTPGCTEQKNSNPTPRGTNPEPSGGQHNTGPKTASQTQAQQEQGTKRANEDGDDRNARKPSRFMWMARKLRKKGFDVTCPAEVRQGRSGGSTDLVFWVRIRLEGREYLRVLHTGDTISIVARKILPCGDLKNIMPTSAIHMGDGHVVHSCGDCEVDVPMGSRSIAHRFYVMDTEAYDFVLGTYFFVEHSQILFLKLQAPSVLHVDHGNGRESVPLEQSEHALSYLRVCKKRAPAMMVAGKTEDYQLLWGCPGPGSKGVGILQGRSELGVVHH